MHDLVHKALHHHQNGRLDEASQLYSCVLQEDPTNATVWHLLGLILYAQGKYNQAAAHIRKALANGTPEVDWYANLGGCLRATGEYAQAHDALTLALSLDPNHQDALNNMGIVLKSLGDIEGCIASLRRVIALNPHNTIAHSNLLFSLSAGELLSVEDTLNEYRAWDHQHGQREHLPRRSTRQKTLLRIGYVSCDLHAHPVSRFLEPILRNHNDDVVTVFVYADVRRPDPTTETLKSLCKNWRSIHGIGDPEVAKLINEDEIDILIDLSGHTAYNRLGVFAYKAAPVQATYLGYFGPTGMSAIDYWITDHTLHPADTREQTQEIIYRLPRCWVAYSPPPEAPLPNVRMIDSPLTFASFNDATKLTTDVLNTWAEILKRLPNARLHLQAKQFQTPEICARFQAGFEARGVHQNRISFSPHTTIQDYFYQYHQTDIVLDPFPRTGGTTVADALWMGVPVVSLSGDRYVSRIATSKLHCLGLKGWACETKQAYIETAVHLAENSMLRAEFRRSLRAHVATSELCNGLGLTQALEEAYREIWNKHHSARSQSANCSA
jgi:predicted O-linked N-acetylglucosamine transferase (SPINDLY family)